MTNNSQTPSSKDFHAKAQREQRTWKIYPWMKCMIAFAIFIPFSVFMYMTLYWFTGNNRTAFKLYSSKFMSAYSATAVTFTCHLLQNNYFNRFTKFVFKKAYSGKHSNPSRAYQIFVKSLYTAFLFILCYPVSALVLFMLVCFTHVVAFSNIPDHNHEFSFEAIGSCWQCDNAIIWYVILVFIVFSVNSGAGINFFTENQIAAHFVVILIWMFSVQMVSTNSHAIRWTGIVHHSQMAGFMTLCQLAPRFAEPDYDQKIIGRAAKIRKVLMYYAYYGIIMIVLSWVINYYIMDTIYPFRPSRDVLSETELKAEKLAHFDATLDKAAMHIVTLNSFYIIVPAQIVGVYYTREAYKSPKKGFGAYLSKATILMLVQGSIFYVFTYYVMHRKIAVEFFNYADDWVWSIGCGYMFFTGSIFNFITAVFFNPDCSPSVAEKSQHSKPNIDSGVYPAPFKNSSESEFGECSLLESKSASNIRGVFSNDTSITNRETSTSEKGDADESVCYGTQYYESLPLDRTNEICLATKV